MIHSHALPHKLTPHKKSSPNIKIHNSRHSQLHIGIPHNTELYHKADMSYYTQSDSHRTNTSSLTSTLSPNKLQSLDNTRTHPIQQSEIGYIMQVCTIMHNFGPQPAEMPYDGTNPHPRDF